MDEKFRSRKWLLTLLLLGTATSLLVGNYISETIWRDVAIMVGGAYFAAQAYIDRNVKK
jgi:hypothetical protein